jgi:hypothetical protein
MRAGSLLLLVACAGPSRGSNPATDTVSEHQVPRDRLFRAAEAAIHETYPIQRSIPTQGYIMTDWLVYDTSSVASRERIEAEIRGSTEPLRLIIRCLREYREAGRWVPAGRNRSEEDRLHGRVTDLLQRP